MHILECVYIVLSFMTLSNLHQLISIWNVITPDLVKRYCYINYINCRLSGA